MLPKPDIPDFYTQPTSDLLKSLRLLNLVLLATNFIYPFRPNVLLKGIRKRWDLSCCARHRRDSAVCFLWQVCQQANRLRTWLACAEPTLSGFAASPVNIKVQMPFGIWTLIRKSFNSEKVGFEPTVQVTPHNTLAGCRLKPLGHFSNTA